MLAKEKQARREANLAQLRAEADKAKATAEAARSGEVTRFLEEMLEGVDPQVAMGRDTALLRGILDTTAKRLDVELTNQPEVQADLKFQLGETYRALWQYEQAEMMFRQALAIRIRLYGEENEAVTDVMNSLANALIREGKAAEGERLVRKTLAIRRHLLWEENVKVADSVRLLGAALSSEGKWTESETMLRQALQTDRKLLGDEDTRLGDTLIDLGVDYFAQGKYREAEEFYRETLTNLAPLGEYHPHVLVTKSRLSDVLFAQSKNAEAEAVVREVVAGERQASGEQTPQPLLAYSLKSLANYLEKTGRYEEAERDYREALTVERKLGEDTDPRVADSLNSLVSVMLQQHKLDEAVQLLSSMPQLEAGLLPTQINLLREHCDLLARLGRWREASDIAKVLLDHNPDNYANYHVLAPLLVAGTNLAEYRNVCREMIKRFRNTKSPYAADPMAKDCLILPSAVEDLEPVAAMAETAVTGTESLPPYPFFEVCKALAEYRQGHYDGAIKWASAAAQVPFPYSQAEAYATLAMAECRLKQIENSRTSLAKCAEVVETEMPEIQSGDLGGDWRDWIIAHALLAEAKNMIQDASLPNNNSPEK